MKRLILTLALSLFLFSCSKESGVSSPTASDYLNLSVGRYWVYEWFEIDKQNNETFLNKRDSIVVEKDTLINGRLYFIKKQNLLGGSQISKTFLYDSANSIYSFPDKQVFFSLSQSSTFTRKIGQDSNPIAIGYYSLDNTESKIKVPAGDFTTVNFKGKIEFQQPNYPYGVRYNDNHYSLKTGLVKVRTQFASSPNDLEMRLIRFGTFK